MKKNKKIQWIVLIGLILFFGGGMIKFLLTKENINNAELESVETPFEDEKEEVEPDPEPEPEGPFSLYTGLPTTEEIYLRRPVGVMISNIKGALPQYGIAQADIVYETLVEGGITRLYALFQDFDAEKIGPIRSARHYYLDFALDHDALYVHVGQSEYAKKAFKQLDVDRFYGIGSLEEYFTFIDPKRVRPHSTFTSYEKLMETWDYLEYIKEIDIDKTRKLNFKDYVEVGEGVALTIEADDETVVENNLETQSDESTELSVINQISLDYSGAYSTNPKFVYNEDKAVYERYQFGEKHIDAATNEHISFKNIIIQYASIWQIKNDALGCMDMELLSEGEGVYISEGIAVPITWQKEDHYTSTQYYTLDGEPLLLNPGKTFISVFPKNRIDNVIME